MANPILTSQMVQDDNLDALLAKLKQLEGVVGSLTQSLLKEEAAAAELEATTKTLNATTANGREQILKNAKAADEVEKAHRNYSKALATETAQLHELRLATQTINQLKKNEAKFALAAEGSYNQLSAQYSIVKLNLNAMSKAEREATAEGQALVKQANAIYQEMKRLQKETGNTALNVGNYSEAVEDAVRNVGEMRKELLALRNTSFEGLSEQQIAGINKRIGDLTDGIADLKAEQAALGTETTALAVGSLKFLAAGLEGLVGTLSLLGVENENLRELERKMVQLIAVTQALSEIEDVLQKRTLQAAYARAVSIANNVKDTVSKWANAVATTAAARAEDARAVATARGNIVTRAAAAVQWLWNAALAANPIGLVVAGVAALVAGIVLLTRALSDNTDEIERQSEAYDRIVKMNKAQEETTRQQIALAKERGESEVIVTNMELKAAKQRQKANEDEYLRFLDLHSAKKNATDEDIQRLREYKDAVVSNANEIEILEARLKRQEKEAQDEADKEAKRMAEERKRESDQQRRERERREKEQQDARLKELEVEREFQLSKFDSETDYGNKLLAYTEGRAIQRFEIEQAANKAILEEQLKFGRISQKEFDAAMNAQIAAFKRFEQEIKESRQAANEGLSVLPGIDLSKKAETKALDRVKAISQNLANEAQKTLQANAEKAEAFSIYDTLGINISEEGKNQVKGAFDFAKQQLTDFLNFRVQMAQRNVDARNREVEAAERALDREIQFAQLGLANNVETRQKDLANAQANQRKALQEQEKAERAQRRIQTIEQATNLVTAIAKVFSSVPFPLNIAASALMLGAFVSAKVQASRLAKREFAEGDFQILEGGSHASGNDIPLGTRSKDGRQEFAEGGEARIILSKSSTSKYRQLLPDIYQALKAKRFEHEFQRIGKPVSDTAVIVQAGGTSVNTKLMENELRAIRRNGEEKTYVDGKGRTVTKYKNLTTVQEN